MTIIYRAYFLEDIDTDSDYPSAYQPKKDTLKAWLQRKSFTIKIEEKEFIEREDRKILFKNSDGTLEWKGWNWAPHSPWAYSKADAVQILRWNCMGLFGYREEDRNWKNKEEWQAAQIADDRRKLVCDNWLKNAGIEPIPPWWEAQLPRRIIV